MLRNREVLLVTKVKDLDVSLVPRVTLEELDTRGSYEMVRVFFNLDWLVAERQAEELKGMLSPHSKITALKTTNRLDVVDTAGSLRRVRQLLQEEQSSEQKLVREFELKNTRAADIIEKLQTLLESRAPLPRLP